MKKKMVKACTLALSGLMTISSVSPAFAYDLDVNGNSIENVEYQNTEDEDYTNKTSVFAELGSEYKVTIPKTIVLSGIDKKADYYVKVEGDIAGYEIVNVVPDESVVLSTKNKSSQTGTITQDKTAWKVSDFDIDANGTVQADNLTAGKWSGTFNFNIYMDSHEEFVLGDLVLPPIGFDALSPVQASASQVVNAKVGDSGNIDITYNNEDVADDSIVTSSNENVVKVNQNRLTAVGEGTSTITVDYNTAKSGNDEGIKSYSFDVKVVKNNETEPVSEPTIELPAAGTKLSEMSFTQIQRIAKEGKTADYGIKLGDTIKVNDSIDAEIISIGSDYIEFCTVQKVVNTDYDSMIKTGPIGYETTFGVYNSSFYIKPQVNNGTVNTAQISYVGSNIQSEVNTWLDSQSDEFKTSLKSVEREYEVATLTYDTSTKKYNQTTTGAITDIEKVYIPTKTELENIYTISDNHKKGMCWTATPYALSDASSADFAFGYFYLGCNGYIFDSYGTYYLGYSTNGAVAMFRIG